MDKDNEKGNIFNIIELQERKNPKKQQSFTIKFQRTIYTEKKELKKDDIEMEEIQIDDIKEEKKEKEQVIFKDKRKSASNLLDREAILKRLKMMNPIETKLLSRAPEIIVEENPQNPQNPQNEKPIEEDTNVNISIQEEVKRIKEGQSNQLYEDKIKQLDEDAFIPLEQIEQIDPKKKRGRKPKQDKQQMAEELEKPFDLSVAKIGKSLITDRLQKKQKVKMGVSAYYMNNRKLFIAQLSKMLKPYRDKIAENAGEISCKTARNESIDFELLSHQLVVRDYLNLYTPYRGLLLYHGLGSGKTCTSIGIAEGMKSGKSIVLMTPASLKMNFFSELKKCGDVLYKKNQFWEFISINGEPQNVRILSHSLGLTPEYITEHGGAWMVDITKPSNFARLTDSDQKSVDEQLNEMIRSKYQDINYNGLNANKMNELSNDGKKNPFDDKVVIIDEAHNLVSRIANAITKKKSIAGQLYQYLLDATNVKIIFLTGTPIINTPREIGILFNMLRGYIKTWTFQLQISTSEKINRDILIDYLHNGGLTTYDFVDYSGDKLIITRNPFGFVNIYARTNMKKGGSKKSKAKTKKVNNMNNVKKKLTKNNRENQYHLDSEKIDEEEFLQREKEYNKVQQVDLYEGGGSFEDYSGVKLDEMGNISDAEFQKKIIRILENRGINVVGKPKIVKELALPDNAELFNELFINNQKGELVNTDLLKRRILGLTSYFRSAQEQLLPQFVKDKDGSNYHIINIDMSTHQFNLYKDIRKDERDDEAKKRKTNAKKKGQKTDEDDDKFTSTYRIYSRSVCNFAFPIEKPRPMLRITDDIDAFNGLSEDIAKKAEDYFDDELKLKDDNNEHHTMRILDQSEYQEKIKEAYNFLEYNRERQRDKEFLIERELHNYSPKFSKILDNIKKEQNKGLHLLYSQFRTLEGIGIFKLVLEANGFVEFKISKKSGEWQIDNADISPENPRFVLYTGTETAEEKEIIRNIYNSTWEFVPPSIVSVLKNANANNFYGEVIKLIMITSSGAEGINLRNTRFVHIMEPYWNMVRIDQVVGRARRICSHEDLPEELRTVQVFVYISRVTQDQLSKNIEMRINDVSKLEYPVVQKNGDVKMEKIPFSTDQYLFEIAQIKDSINKQILTAVKESAIDCSLYNTNPEEPVVCYGFGKVSSNNFGSYPILEVDRSQKPEMNVRTEKQTLVGVTVNDIKYAMDKKTRTVYDFESYKKAKDKKGELIAVGTLNERTQTIIFDK